MKKHLFCIIYTIILIVSAALSALGTFVFPKDLIMNFPDGTLEKDVLFVRKKSITDNFEYIDQNLYCFKFLNLTPDEKMILKNFLLKID